ncbi:WxL domain-containing protein [Levilactobacillus acidifarinae]|uniref:WxL domain-containing protein n=2 Tax=Levilactobacillus acidifarinae TaxID=267364 RepID=A0A0R1LQT3_9LACO|nr:hypothetical protein FD25_GL000572 [Levilactobacillus acidifarinae DSM 19394]
MTSVVAHAAATANQTASVEVDKGQLVFQSKDGKAQTPSFTFNNPKVSAASQTVGLNSNNATTLGISNQLGTGEPWYVSAQLGTFTSTDSNKRTLEEATLNFAPDSTTGSDPVKLSSTNLIAGGSAAPLLSAAKDTGMGDVATSLAKTTLTLPKVTYAGTYTAQLTYTLTTGPQS